MARACHRFCWAAAWAAAAGAPASAETVRLRAGHTLHGEIVAADEQGLQFRRWDNGGACFIPWPALVSSEGSRLREALQRSPAAARATVQGVRIVTRQNVVLEGIVVEETPDRVVLKIGTRRPQVPVSGILHRVDLELDAEAVYTPEELYEQRAKITDLLAADGHLALAEYCLALRLPAKAREHYQRAAEVDPARADAIAKLLEDFDARIKEAEARKLRSDLLAFAAAGKFEKEVKEALQKLRETYADTEAARDLEELAGRLAAEEEQYRKNRDEFLRRKILGEWYDTLERLIRKKASDRKSTQKDGKEYVDSKLEAEIKAKLASTYGIPESEVDRYWSERQPAGTRSAGYGSGTWIYEGGQAGAVGGGTMLNRLLGGGNKGQGGGRGGQPQPGAAKPKAYKLETAEEWWSFASPLQRAEWMEAAFAEKALIVVQRKTRICSQCGGEGVIRRITSGALGGSSEELPCRRCHGVKHDITVIYK